MSTPPTTSLREQMELERSARVAWVIANAHRPAAQASAFAEPTLAPTPAAPAAEPVPEVLPSREASSTVRSTTGDPMTFFQKFEAEFKKLIGEAPAVEVKIAATLPVATKLLATVLTLIPATAAEAPAVTAIVGKIQTGLVASSVLIQGAVNDPTVPGILADVTSNLSSIEAAAQIKDPATLAKLNETVATITGEVGAIAAALPTA
jgi:hypothetical protein